MNKEHPHNNRTEETPSSTMGRFTVLSGALATCAFMSFLDGMLSLASLPFPVVVPFLLSSLGFFLMAMVEPKMLLSGYNDAAFVTMAPVSSSGGGSDPFAQVRMRGSFVLGTMLQLISTAIALTMNGVADGTTGCSSGRSDAPWPGFSLVFQSWLWLAASTALFVDKCRLSYPGAALLVSSDE